MMLHWMFEDGDWFESKRYGYGAGPPIAWQGWAVIGCYMLAVTGACVAVAAVGTPGAAAGGVAFILIASWGLLIIVRKHTRGGWRWRWGKGD